MKTRIGMTVALVGLFLCAGVVNADTMWDCNADYVLPGSSADSHGWTSGNISNPDTAASFAPLDVAEWIFSGTTAHKYQSGYVQPDEIYNSTDSEFWIDGGTVLVMPKTLTRHAANLSGLLAALRWTAPATGDYQVDAQIFGVNTVANTTNSMIVKNLNFGTKIAEGSTIGFYTAPGATVFNYSGIVSLLAGDTLEFASDGRTAEAGNNVAFQVTISQVPEPGTLAMVATGLLGLLAYAWRKRK